MSSILSSPLALGLRRVLPLFILIGVVAAGIALVVVRQIPPVHQTHYSYFVSLVEREESLEYRFDGYYALQATELFTTTLAGLAQAPEIVAAAYEAAHLPLPTQDPRQLVRRVNARKVAPQLVEITIRETDQARAQQLAEGLTAELTDHVARYNTESIPGLAFKVTATEPWHGTRGVAVSVIVVATFVFTVFILINIWLLFVAFAPASSPRG